VARFAPDGQSAATANVVTFNKDDFLIWRLFKTTQDLVDESKRELPRCLTRQQRGAFLDAVPPEWCIGMEKWPYQTQDWKDWLHFKRSHGNPPLPDSPEWQQWVAAHR